MTMTMEDRPRRRGGSSSMTGEDRPRGRGGLSSRTGRIVLDDGEDRSPGLVDRVQFGVNRVVSSVDERYGGMRVWFAH